jgi:hypothetical protein
MAVEFVGALTQRHRMRPRLWSQLSSRSSATGQEEGSWYSPVGTMRARTGPSSSGRRTTQEHQAPTQSAAYRAFQRARRAVVRRGQWTGEHPATEARRSGRSCAVKISQDPRGRPLVPKSVCWIDACSCGHSHSYSRSVRSLKKAAMSRLSRPGTSAAGKWPPLGMGVHRRMLYRRSAHSRGGVPSSMNW